MKKKKDSQLLSNKLYNPNATRMTKHIFMCKKCTTVFFFFAKEFFMDIRKEESQRDKLFLPPFYHHMFWCSFCKVNAERNPINFLE